MPLAYARPGETVRVKAIGAGRNLSRRLGEMGIYPGSVVRVLSNQGGPIILQVGESRLAIGRGMAIKILVEA